MIKKARLLDESGFKSVPSSFPRWEQKSLPRLVKTIDGEGGPQSASRSHLLTTLTEHPIDRYQLMLVLFSRGARQTK